MPQTAEQRSEQASKAAQARYANGGEPSNQFTTGKRTRHDKGTIDAVRAEFAAKKLMQCVKGNGKSTLDRNQVAAARALLDKGKPSLQAIEQTNIDPAASLSESQIRENIKQLLVEHGSLVAEILAEIAREREPSFTSVEKSSDAVQQVA